MTILEVFSCSGAMAEGLRRAGLAPSMAFDADPDACASYEANLGHRPIQVDARDLLRLVRDGWSPGPVDLFVADPPCTPWSRAGKRLGVEDERDMLGVTVELISLLQPRAWLIANVPGLDDGPNWPTVQRTIGSLAPGYCIDFARLDAADYGVPQHRVRPFWYGHRSASRCIEWPSRTHAGPDACGATLPGITERRKPWVTCREALGHLSGEDLGRPVRLRSYTVTTKGDGRGAHGACVLQWPWDRPSTTVTSTDRLGPPEHHDGSFLSAPNAIKISEKAAAILQGFPPGWTFSGKTKASRWSQIGQAMPLPLAEAVATSIAGALGRSTRAA